MNRWNRALSGLGLELRLPHIGFHRRVGAFAGHHVSPDGRLLDATAWEQLQPSVLPTDHDRAHVASLMVPVTQPGQFAGWLAPPATGINTKPVDFEYVRI